MPKRSTNSGYPLVSLRGNAGEPIRLVFRDQHKVNRSPSTNTSDPEVAKELARKLSEILVGKLFNDPPSDTPKMILDWLGISPKLQGIQTGFTTQWWENFQAGEGSSPAANFASLFAYYAAACNYGKETTEKLESANRTIAVQKGEIERLSQKVKAYEAHRVAEGLSIAENIQPVTLSQAWKNFLGEGEGDAGTRADVRFKKTMRNVLKAFAKSLGESRLISDVKPGEIIDFLRKLKVLPETRGQYGTGIILPMLAHCSGGLYRTEPVRKWIADHKLKEKRSKGEEDWYWLEDSERDELLKLAPGIVGPYWADAILCQYWLGLRPEEIPLLQSKNVSRKGKKVSHIYLEPIKDGKDVIRRLKTPDSTASIPVISTQCEKAFLRRLKKGAALLFPRDHKECGGREPQWKRYKRTVSEWERNHLLWHVEKFDAHYLEKLREVISQVPSIDKDRFDARTLRRTRGKDLVLQTRSIEAAAAFLRDKPSTVERHYARLLPKDLGKLIN